MSEEEAEATESSEVEVPTYSLSNPELLEAMIEVTELLDRVARGEMSSREARTLYSESILPKLRELEAKHAPKPVQKKVKPEAPAKKPAEAKGKAGGKPSTSKAKKSQRKSKKKAKSKSKKKAGRKASG